jgi:peptidoglycan/LPS O-acetylase OafA/YrhL
MQSSFPTMTNRPMAYLSNLDGIRAVAVLLVVVSHLLLQITVGQEPAGYSFRAMGRVGVAIFFVHTTFVLMASLERHGPAAIPFYVRRIFRIYPLSVVIVLLFALLQISAGIPIDMEKFLSNLFLVQNITDRTSLPMPLWSLPYEIQMYLVLPALYQMTKARRPLMWTGMFCVCSVLIVLPLPPTTLAWKVMRYVPCFLPGVLAFVLRRQVQGRTSPMVLFGLIVGGGVVGIPMLVAAGVPELPLMWALCISIGLALSACRQLEDGYFTRGSKLIAKYSYGIYLTHVLALGAIDGLMPGPVIVQWVAMLILLPGLAFVCYHGLEKHGIALGVRLSARLTESARECRQNQPERP